MWKILILFFIITSKLCCAFTPSVPDPMPVTKMIVGDQMVEIANTRQLTLKSDGSANKPCISPNGKYVAYKADKPDGCSGLLVVKSIGGQPHVLLQEPMTWNELQQNHEEHWYIADFVWSPDSRLVAVDAILDYPSDSQKPCEYYLLVLTITGDVKASIKRPKELLLSYITWSRDNHKVAAAGHWFNDDLDVFQTGVLIFDLDANTMQTVYIQNEGPIKLIGWTSVNKGLLCETTQEDPKSFELNETSELREIYTDGKPDDVITKNYKPDYMQSSDDMFFVVKKTRAKDGSDPKLVAPYCFEPLAKDRTLFFDVASRSTGKTIASSQNDSVALGWSPNSKMLLYRRNAVAFNDPDGRIGSINMLWLITPASHKYDRMCISLDSGSSSPTWSVDSKKIAYIRDNCVYMAELASRPATPLEKLTADAPLNEEDEKVLILSNAEHIAYALLMYANEHDGRFPLGGCYTKEMNQYTSDDRSEYRRPGTEQEIFTYHQPDKDKMEHPESEIIGVLDAGYSWKVVIYADYKVRLINE
ncbi:MAG: hypothetical protein ABFD46_04870 [Armatimonadota bacterium]